MIQASEWIVLGQYETLYIVAKKDDWKRDGQNCAANLYNEDSEIIGPSQPLQGLFRWGAFEPSAVTAEQLLRNARVVTRGR